MSTSKWKHPEKMQLGDTYSSYIIMHQQQLQLKLAKIPLTQGKTTHIYNITVNQNKQKKNPLKERNKTVSIY